MQEERSHVDVWRLEAALVDVVEGEGLGGVGAVLVHLHGRPAPALAGLRTLRLLPPGRHDFGQREGHAAAREKRLSFQRLAETAPSLRTGVQTDWDSERAHSHTEWRREHHLLAAPPPPLLRTSSAPEGHENMEHVSFWKPQTNFEKLEVDRFTLSPNT